MAEFKFIKERIRRVIQLGIVPAACVLILAGCQNLPFPFNGSLATNSTQPATTTLTKPGSGQGTTGGGAATTAGSVTTTGHQTGGAVTTSLTIPTKPTRVLALEKYKAARLTRTSEKMSHLWSVESEYPLKTGENTLEANFGPNGRVTTARGSVVENYAGTVKRSDWVLSAKELVVTTGEDVQRRPRTGSMGQTYDFERLVEVILSQYSVSEEDGTYFVKLTTEEEATVKLLMECLGYRKTDKDAYKGSLYLEALLEESSGNLRSLSYVFRNSLEGYADNGQITFSDWDVPVSIEGSASTVPGKPSTTPATTSGTPGTTTPATTSGTPGTTTP